MMKVIWKSFKGLHRIKNSDYGIFCNYSRHYIFIIGDAREEIESNYFIKYILEFIAEKLCLQNPNEIKHILKSAKDSYIQNEGIPKSLPNQMASLHILIVDKSGLQTQSFNLGDCRFGYEVNGQWEWLTEPQVIPTYEHYVTQSFRTMRSIGEIVKQEFCLDQAVTYCLGSDGYWRGQEDNYDDSSYLLISGLDSTTVEILSEGSNFKYFNQGAV